MRPPNAAPLSRPPQRRRLPAWLAPSLITLLGAGLRFFHLGDFYVNVDQAYPIAQAIRWLAAGQWPTLGQGTSVLFANPPGMSYLMAVPWLLLGSEWGASFFDAALNLLAVPLTYQAGRLAGGRKLGLAAAALAALNPWVALFSRNTWVQGLLPFWSTLTATLLLLALYQPGGRPRPRARGGLLFAALLALTGLTQMYLLAFLSLLPAALILLLNWRRLPRRPLLAGLAVLIAASALYGWQLARDWTDQGPRVAEFFNTGQPARLDASAFNHAVRFVTGADYEAVYGNDGTAGARARRVLGQVVATALTAVVVLGLLLACWRVGAAGGGAGLWLAVLIWWGAPIAALSLPSHPVNIAYLLLSLPAGYLLAGPILADLAGSWLGLPALLALGACSLALMLGGEYQVAAHPAVIGLDDLSVNAILKFTPTAQAVAQRYHLDEFYAALDSQSLTTKVGQPLQAVNWTPLPSVELFQVGQPAVYLRIAQNGARPEALHLASTVAEVDYPAQSVITFDLIPAYTREQLAALPQTPVGWPSQQGLTLVGYDIVPGTSPGAPPGARDVWVYWTVDTLSPERGQWIFAPYVRVTDASGRQWARAGAPAVSGYQYRQGDVFVSRLSLPALPAGRYNLDFGMYDGVHQLAVELLPPGGAPAIDYYRGPLTVP